MDLTDVRIKVRESGPYLVTGRVTLVDADGNPYTVAENFVLCRCGGSQSKPFCDGSHKTNGFCATERTAKSESEV
jgi:CDGSH iron-sulfur domain-containing protein 3